MVCSASAHADVAVSNVQYFVVRSVLRGMQTGIAESRQRIGRDGGITVLSDSDDGGHVKFSVFVQAQFYH
jgi:hypothetical protein